MPSKNNKLIISAAGSGKTTYLVREALKVSHGNVLITTYTEANEQEIKKKFYDINGSIPINITIQTWFSFLLQHGVRPYQGTIFDGHIKGMLLVNGASGINYVNKQGISVPFTEEKDFQKHYFSKSDKLYSDKLAKFVVKCNTQSKGKVVDRLERIYNYVFVDEVQDLAGNDLEFLKLLFKSKINTTLVGDPRQVTYLTHNEKKYHNYKDGNIKQFILDKCAKECTIDETTLGRSHRNNAEICSFSSKLYPLLEPSIPCDCIECRSSSSTHNGVFLVSSGDIDAYRVKYNPVVLRHQLAIEPEWNYGNCKGLGFDRVLIYPTETISKYLCDGRLSKEVKDKSGNIKHKNAFDIAKFYVALTRARYSVAIVCNNFSQEYIDGLIKWSSKGD
ncbi:UvrD-helicase domain-containing protein [Pedobacter chitinilyticus]|uniref:DNA 3'-5' helicase II n=1 Tax=Pedobacter chitinilyticus TaxID=2233776 RepID=A0A3S3PU94_9SPHI|nr:UvrD-helicase domain-containing protein [Pedobacter chitinilyticus]RWU08120.1 ATP-dependent helicase [Pedobacter chitinilyticus]